MNSPSNAAGVDTFSAEIITFRRIITVLGIIHTDIPPQKNTVEIAGVK
jgi:hypothetical protein